MFMLSNVFMFEDGVNECIFYLMPYNACWIARRYKILGWIKTIERRDVELWEKCSRWQVVVI